MNPTPDPAANSPLATLRQLKEMLDAGTITPPEFEALKQQLIFNAAPGSVPTPPAEPTPVTPEPTPYFDTPAALTPEATPLLTPEPDWLAAPALSEAETEAADLAETDDLPGDERRNPLNLVFAIGGLLLFLGVMAYLFVGRSAAPDEHLTSTSQTPADTTALAPEVGPQAEQLTLPPAAAPETIRVAPATPPITPAAATPATDSATIADPQPARPAASPPPAKVVPAPAKTAPPAPASSSAPPAADTTKAGQP